MKALRTSLLLVMVFSLTSSISYGQTAEDYYNKGIDYGVAGKFEEAQEELTKALEADPLYALATLSLKLSEDALKRRIKVETAVHLFKGIAYRNKAMLDEAIAEYKKAIETNPNYAQAHYNLGLAYSGLGMRDEAAGEYNKAIEINPNLAEAHNNLGIIYHHRGIFGEAAIEYKMALEINPNYAQAHKNLGLVYADMEMLDQAIAELKKALEIDPSLDLVHIYLALIYYDKGEYSLAIKHRDRAMELGYKVSPEFLRDLEPYREK